MADTTAGAIATDVHRRRQVRLAIRAESEIRRAWRTLDLTNIDATRGAWLLRMQGIVSRYHGISASDAAAYLARYRLAEIGTTTGPLVMPGIDVASASRALDAAGPQALKARIAKGMDPNDAYMSARAQILGATRRQIMAGGRDLVRESARADTRAVGWRRVSDGDPCTFCAMLVSRGPAYTSEAKALAKGNGDPYHDHCGCGIEVLYGPWEPTEAEQVWVDAYYDAAEEATDVDGERTAATVLWRLRERGEFRDSPARRAVEAATD